MEGDGIFRKGKGGGREANVDGRGAAMAVSTLIVLSFRFLL